MIDRRRAIRLALAALPAAQVLRSSAARAEQSFQRFVPFLVDLDGWKGNKPEGMSMETTGASMITATREYRRDNYTCRDYNATTYRDGRQMRRNGSACRMRMEAGTSNKARLPPL